MMSETTDERDRDRDDREDREDQEAHVSEKFTWTAEDISGIIWLDETEKEKDDGGIE